MCIRRTRGWWMCCGSCNTFSLPRLFKAQSPMEYNVPAAFLYFFIATSYCFRGHSSSIQFSYTFTVFYCSSPQHWRMGSISRAKHTIYDQTSNTSTCSIHVLKPPVNFPIRTIIALLYLLLLLSSDSRRRYSRTRQGQTVCVASGRDSAGAYKTTSTWTCSTSCMTLHQIAEYHSFSFLLRYDTLGMAGGSAWK